MSEEELRRLVVVEHAGIRLKRLFVHKQKASRAEGFFMMNKVLLRTRHFRLTTVYLNKLLNTIFSKKIEGFFLVYKKRKFLEDVNMQREVLVSPFATTRRLWKWRVWGALHKLRVFKNIVNNYEYHIQPFQKRSLKNNVIGLLREMRMNNHSNQRIMLRDPQMLKRNLLLHVTDKLIRGKTEKQMEDFFGIVKGQDRELLEAGQKLKRLEFLLRGMIRTRYALFFRDFVVYDKSIMDDQDNRSHFSHFTRHTTKGKRPRTGTHTDLDPLSRRMRNKTGVFGHNDPDWNKAPSFDLRNSRGTHYKRDSHGVGRRLTADGRQPDPAARDAGPEPVRGPERVVFGLRNEGSHAQEDSGEASLRRGPGHFSEETEPDVRIHQATADAAEAEEAQFGE